jgi:hypothetical protein
MMGQTAVRVNRVMGQNDGCADLTPFELNPNWILTLRLEMGQNTITGSLLLPHGPIPQQEVPVRGWLRLDSVRPLEWQVVVRNMVGEPIEYDFRGSLQNSTLQGECEYAGNATTFLYSVDELPPS